MKKTFTVAMVVLVAMTGLFAEKKDVQKKRDGVLPPPPPVKVELSDPAVVKEYHDAQARVFKELLDAQVKAGVITQEWADAKLALLKAVQADCKGQCILQHRTDLHFGGMGPCKKGDFGHRDCPEYKNHDHGRRRFRDAENCERPGRRYFNGDI